MPQVKDVARVTRSGRAVPDVTRNELPVNAWLVWETAKNKALAAKNVERQQHQGEDGYLWHGAMTGIFRELWVGMLDSYTGDKNEVVTAKRQLSTYLTASHNMVCIDRGQHSGLDGPSANNRPPTWWVRAEWNDAPPQQKSQALIQTYTERKLTPHEAGEDRSPAPVVVSRVERVVPKPTQLPPTALTEKKPIVCTDCGRPFTDDRYLSQHRAAIHGDPGDNPSPATITAAVGVNQYGATKDERQKNMIAALVERTSVAEALDMTSSRVAATLNVSQGVIYSVFASLDDVKDKIRAFAASNKMPVPSGGAVKATPVVTSNGLACPECPRTFTAQQALAGHLSGHQTRRRILRTAADLLERDGWFSNETIVSASNGAIGHYTTVYNHFTSKQALIDEAIALLHSEGREVKAIERATPSITPPAPTLVDASISLDDTMTRLLSIITFAARIGSPISSTAAQHLINDVSPKVRADAVNRLIDTDAVQIERRHTANGRPFDALVPLREADLSLVTAATVEDPITLIESFLADYRKLRSMQGQSDEVVKAQQQARQAAEQRAADIEAELTELKEKLRNFSSLFGV